MSDKTFIKTIDLLLAKKHFTTKDWEERGLNPSTAAIKDLLEKTATHAFQDFKNIGLDLKLDKEQKEKAIREKVDLLPWDDFDTEEKEFLAEALAPAIEALGFNPWNIF